jgi:hypothetical protein
MPAERSTVDAGSKRRVLSFQHGDLATGGGELPRQANQRDSQPGGRPRPQRIVLSRKPSRKHRHIRQARAARTNLRVVRPRRLHSCPSGAPPWPRRFSHLRSRAANQTVTECPRIVGIGARGGRRPRGPCSRGPQAGAGGSGFLRDHRYRGRWRFGPEWPDVIAAGADDTPGGFGYFIPHPGDVAERLGNDQLRVV